MSITLILSTFLKESILFRHLILHVTQRKESSFLVAELILVSLSETWQFPFFASDRFRDGQITVSKCIGRASSYT